MFKEDKMSKDSGFLLKQRAFLKLYLITMTEQGRLYGLRFLENLREDFKPYAYRPTHTEIYKALHDLIEDGVLKREKRIKEGMKYQEVVYYVFQDHSKADLYKKQLKDELERNVKMLKKALKDNY
jgi:DNA-binding PadR family transcriptional regulator